MLENTASLADTQAYVNRVLTERGVDDETLAQKFMLLMEEMGELAQAARKHAGIKTGKDKQLVAIEDEVGDVLIVLLDICNNLGVDAQAALVQKEAKNSRRKWT